MESLYAVQSNDQGRSVQILSQPAEFRKLNTMRSRKLEFSQNLFRLMWMGSLWFVWTLVLLTAQGQSQTPCHQQEAGHKQPPPKAVGCVLTQGL